MTDEATTGLRHALEGAIYAWALRHETLWRDDPYVLTEAINAALRDLAHRHAGQRARWRRELEGGAK